MSALTKSTFLLSLMVALTGASACGDDNNDDNKPKPDAGTDAGGDGDRSDSGTDAGGDGDQTFELTGDVGDVEGTAQEAQCHETSDTRDEGGCYSFYCGTNSNSIKAGATSSAACGSDAEVYYACDGATTRKVSDCARLNALRPDPSAATRDCVREDSKLDVITNACLDCYVKSADCAREFCVSECLAGNSDACDQCRQENGCTPDFYKCAGLPDPVGT